MIVRLAGVAVDRSWLPGTTEVREDYTKWSVPPPNTLTEQGERLWVLLYRVTVRGFLIWLALVAIWFI